MQTMKLKAKMQQNTKKIINQNTATHSKKMTSQNTAKHSKK